MPPQPDPRPPTAMIIETTRLCSSIRCSPDSLYGRLVRENILDVIGISFPVFRGHIGAEALETLIDGFLATHRATRPQFHHIATEFVQFAQSQRAVTHPLLSLLEYEWVQFAAEIDPAPVSSSDSSEKTDIRSIGLNPTAHLLLLPFDATRLDASDALGNGAQRLPHAVYRTADHTVVTRALTHQDCVLIDLLRTTGSISPAELTAAATGFFDAAQVEAWVERGLESGLLQKIM